MKSDLELFSIYFILNCIIKIVLLKIILYFIYMCHFEENDVTT